MITVWMAYAVAAAATSAMFAVVGYRRRDSGRHVHGIPGQRFESGMRSAAGGQVIDAIRLALKRVGPLMFQHDVRADVAVLPGLVALIKGSILTDVVEDMLTVAVRGAPACRLLLTAVAQGDHVEITVTDDLPNADQAYRLGQVRGLHERVALLGGTLHVTAHPTNGTAIAVRLAASSRTLQAPPAIHGIFSPQSAISTSG